MTRQSKRSARKQQALRDLYADCWPDTSAMRRQMRQIYQQLNANMQEPFADWEERLDREEDFLVQTNLHRFQTMLEQQQGRKQTNKLQRKIRALRAKAKDPSVTTAEAAAFATKADELEQKSQ
jgi:Protein of unknown function (DUF2786)